MVYIIDLLFFLLLDQSENKIRLSLVLRQPNKKRKAVEGGLPAVIHLGRQAIQSMPALHTFHF